MLTYPIHYSSFLDISLATDRYWLGIQPTKTNNTQQPKHWLTGMDAQKPKRHTLYIDRLLVQQGVKFTSTGQGPVEQILGLDWTTLTRTAFVFTC